MLIYVVKQGDTLDQIAMDHQVPVEELIQDNNISGGRLALGQALVIRDGEPDPSRMGIIVNGYAYPFIDMEVLQTSVDSLTSISPFSYEVLEDGGLKDLDDEVLIRVAYEHNIAPKMVIANLTESGFDSDLAHTVLTNPDIRQNLIRNILNNIQKGYVGLDLDFEYIRAEDREAYNDFIRILKGLLKPIGFTLSSALAPRTSDEQTGLLVDGHDYQVHGEYMDHVVLMTYEWGYSYGPAMAVAPVNKVREVLDYAVTRIPREKILMGIPNYGYDSMLPYQEGRAAKVVGNVAAVDLAIEMGAEILFDEEAQAPYFNYTDSDGVQHEVWFEDARSIAAKLDLVEEYQLGGVSYWTVGFIFNQNWALLEDKFRIVRY